MDSLLNKIENQLWLFNKKYSNEQLANILSEYSKDVFGKRHNIELTGDHDADRLVLAANLGFLDRYVADENNRPELEQRGWCFPKTS